MPPSRVLAFIMAGVLTGAHWAVPLLGLLTWH